MIKDLKTKDYNPVDFPTPIFTSMGIFIIDEIHFPGVTLHDILGGGGPFAIVGSRMILSGSNSRRAAWVLDIGNDCPEVIFNELMLWDTGAVIRYDPSRKCTRGWNNYKENDFREFKYLSPKIRIDIPDLMRYTHMLKSKSYHLLCSPERCLELLTKLKPLRSDEPVIVWEPIPDDCTPRSLQRCIDILHRVDVLSPNAAECAAFFGESEPTTTHNCERISAMFLKYMTKSDDAAIVLRCGALGCLLLTNKSKVWFPPYHTKKNRDPEMAIDPTGCGNTFVGAFSTGLIMSGGNLETACVCGTIASGASLEQHGMPKLSHGENEEDLWNGVSIGDRFQKYFADNPQLKFDLSTLPQNFQ